MDSDSEEDENICPVCSRSFPTMAGVRTHWRYHTLEEIQSAINNKVNDVNDRGSTTTAHPHGFSWNKFQIVNDGDVNATVNLYHQFEVIENDAMGDCLFSSILEFLRRQSSPFPNTPNCILGLRSMVVNHIVGSNDDECQSNFDRFQIHLIKNLQGEIPCLTSVNTTIDMWKEDYADYMSPPGKYGTTAELCAMAEIFDFSFCVIRKMDSSNYTCYDYGSIHGLVDHQSKPIVHLLFSGEVGRGHFRLLIPNRMSTIPVILPGAYKLIEEYTSSRLTSIAPINFSGFVTNSSEIIDENGHQELTCDSEFEPSHIANVTPGADPSVQLLDYMRILKSNIRVLKRIPKASRLCSSQDFTKVLEEVTKEINCFESWYRLLSFPFVAFKAPDRKDKATSKLSLATCVKRNLKFWNEIKHLPFQEFFKKIMPTKLKHGGKKTKLDTDEARIKKVQSKLNDGDIKGAIRILSSDESVAPINHETYLKLLEKHPPPELHLEFDDSSTPSIDLVTESEVKVAISKFENGSAGGLDGLRPQHLKDMMGVEIGDHGILLLTRLSKFSNLLLNGNAPDFIIPIIYGASLCALNKKDLSIRPIAVGSTFRRLVAKIACTRVTDKLGSQLKPKQLGFGTKGGAEAGAHAARTFINSNHKSPTVFLKLEYKNAFNELERDPMLSSAYQQCPEIYPFLRQCYSSPTKLVFGDYTILSQRGCQQGDPCGPPLFCLRVNLPRYRPICLKQKYIR